MIQCQLQFHCLRPSINSLGLNIFDNFDIIIIMSVCDRLHSYYHLDRSWISSSIDVVKFLVKLKNSVMPAGDEKKDEAAFVSKVTSTSQSMSPLTLSQSSDKHIENQY